MVGVKGVKDGLRGEYMNLFRTRCVNRLFLPNIFENPEVDFRFRHYFEKEED
jgi:hypothetical protein